MDLVLLDCPSLLLGIDLHFFEANGFRGFSHIPPGLHVFHWGISVDSLRTAKVFMSDSDTTLILQYVAETESFVELTSQMSYVGLTQFPESRPLAVWRDLVSEISTTHLTRILPPSFMVSSATPTLTDELDANRLGDSLSSQDLLKFSDLNFNRTRPKDVHGTDLTALALDRSWQIPVDLNSLATEIQLSWTLGALISNVSAIDQWKSWMATLCAAPSFLSKSPAFYKHLLTLWDIQIQHTPGHMLGIISIPFLETHLTQLESLINDEIDGHWRPDLVALIRKILN
ncbi:hypothetical protein CANCADRAFT_93000 [Tortispora caseinolytica NRRL Y-17796]|uniref:Uncharacterized protein n=1 Tax=Tortispora caseinolytica NRRL Y-17796 TaxID=767744 RepID=A0A1E4TLZ1_9ASCO|nr:hypothetical protein CANCADRAFT_93000 [Tortispora caseinolytica NRRL Y-17796]